ncbi:hypothetical protein FALCPG4_011102 [Fusarium falciforme]
MPSIGELMASIITVPGLLSRSRHLCQFPKALPIRGIPAIPVQILFTSNPVDIVLLFVLFVDSNLEPRGRRLRVNVGGSVQFDHPSPSLHRINSLSPAEVLYLIENIIGPKIFALPLFVEE